MAKLGMKWYKFLKVLLVLGAILNIASGIMQITGFVYELEDIPSEFIYAQFPPLKSIDIGFGIATVLLGLYQFSVVKSLAGYKANSIKKLVTLYVLSMIINCAYTINVGGIIGEFSIPDIIGTIAGNLIMIAINNTYFKNRRDVFVNR